MSRHGTYDLKYGFIPDDDCPQETSKTTNADRIRAMSDEELRDMFFWIQNNVVKRYSDSYLGLLKWLKEEAE